MQQCKTTIRYLINTSILLASTLLHASNGGIPNYSQNETGTSSCHNCHVVDTGSPTNTLSVSGNNTVLVGSSNSFTIKLVAPYFQDISFGGFDLSTNAGTLVSTDAETKIINSELVHSNPKATTNTGSSYDVQWAFDWQAPATAGSATLFACGLPVNGDGKADACAVGYECDGHHSGGGSEDGRATCTTFNIQVQQTPVAVAGNNQTVTEANVTILDGSLSSDADGSISSYLWQQLAGLSAAPISNASTDTANFTAPAVAANATEELVFRLTVTDNDGLVSTDTMSVFVQDVLVSNLSPVADAGANQMVNESTLVNLDASASSDDGAIVSYLWEQVAGINIVLLNNAATVNPDFTAPTVDSAGDTLTFQLTVTDDLGITATSTVDVTVNDVDTAPTATITDASGIVISAINNNSTVTLYGNFSNDPEGPVTAYDWIQTAGPAIINPGVNNENSFSFTTPDAIGSSIDIQLTVTGDEGVVQDAITVTFLLNNLPPDVDAGIDITAIEGTTIELHGAVIDPNNDLTSVQWRQINCASNCIMQPINIPLPLVNDFAIANVFSPSVSAEDSGLMLEFELFAVDSGGLSATSTIVVTVNDNAINDFPEDAIPFISFNNKPMAISVQSLDPAITAIITKLLPEDSATISDDNNRPVSFPYELTELEITLSAPGSVMVTLYFPEAFAEDFDFYQYLINYNWVNTSKAKNFDDLNFDPANGWQEITEEAEFSADRRSISFLLTDGGPSDENPAPLVISTRNAMGQNQPVAVSQPGATGALAALWLAFFSFALIVLKAFRLTG